LVTTRHPPSSTPFPYTTLFRSTVQDRGMGIDRLEMPHIFEPFYRGAAVMAAQIHGTGLGLSLAKSIAEAMGGTLSVVSELAVGRDRKSTRLNSSHVSISYAVFC